MMNARSQHQISHPVSAPARLYCTETVLNIEGGYPMPVLIEYSAAPAEPVNDYPGWIDIVHVKANGLDIRKALPTELLAALAQDIRSGL